MSSVVFMTLLIICGTAEKLDLFTRADSIPLRTTLAIGICAMILTTFFWKQFADLKINKLLYQELQLSLLRI